MMPTDQDIQRIIDKAQGSILNDIGGVIQAASTNAQASLGTYQTTSMSTNATAVTTVENSKKITEGNIGSVVLLAVLSVAALFLFR
jgi:hypothetical protein